MKTFLFAASLAAIGFVSSNAAAQSVIVTPKKIVYKRQKPQADFKKTFEITYPKVKASTPALSRRIESSISFEKVLKLNLQEETGEFQWLEEAGYEIGYNKNGILSIKLFMFGTAAYPDGSSKYVVVNLKTGNRVAPSDVFTHVLGLAMVLKKKQLLEIEDGKKEIRKDPDMADSDPNQLFEYADFTAENLTEFAVNDSGVTFFYDYGFPHVIQALEPEGSYSMTWEEIGPYIKPGGLLARFVR
ncbi:MAG: hypothetical protein H7070_03375 [Saprospiraceae bacterium]|nr:hypothetical protein [Pyrinomonadaceae bacterium]